MDIIAHHFRNIKLNRRIMFLSINCEVSVLQARYSNSPIHSNQERFPIYESGS